MFEAKWYFFLDFLSFLKDWPPLSFFSSSLSFAFRPIFGPTPTTFQSTYNDLQPLNFPLTEVAPTPTRTFRSFQKECPSRYHQFIGLCFNKIVRRNIHFSVISHSLCNRTVILFPVICISQGEIYQWLPILFIIANSIQFKSFYVLIIVTDTSTIVWIACVNVFDRFLCNQGVLYLL